jgi:hypothetical protein
MNEQTKFEGHQIVSTNLQHYQKSQALPQPSLFQHNHVGCVGGDVQPLFDVESSPPPILTPVLAGYCGQAGAGLGCCRYQRAENPFRAPLR